MHLSKILSLFTCWKAPLNVDPDQQGEKVTNPTDGNLIGSLVGKDVHRVVLDIDHKCWLFDSSTDGRHHLLIDKTLSTEDYRKLLTVLVEVGLYQKRCLQTFEFTGMTRVRLPWIAKQSSDTDSAKD